MAMGTERSKALHNFTMPCGLRWGNQRFLRCMKVNSNGQISHLHRFPTAGGGSDQHNHIPIQQRRTTRERERDLHLSSEFGDGYGKVGPTPAVADGGRRFGDEDDDDDGIAATREKVMFDLQTAADKMKYAIFKDGLEEGEVSLSPVPPPPPPPPQQAATAEGEARPWNLRTRRAACKMPAVTGVFASRNGGTTIASTGAYDGGAAKGLRADLPRPNSGFSQMRATAAATTSLKSPMHKGDSGGEKRPREKFSVPLSKRHIEEDFFSMVGHRPPRRPKKRVRIVQKQLDTLFPGLWLSEVTPDMYKVPESAP